MNGPTTALVIALLGPAAAPEPGDEPAEGEPTESQPTIDQAAIDAAVEAAVDAKMAEIELMRLSGTLINENN